MDSINKSTKLLSQFQVKGSGNLAFSIVVLASYFAMFSSLEESNLDQILIMVLLGIAYIAIGIYGNKYVANTFGGATI